MPLFLTQRGDIDYGFISNICSIEKRLVGASKSTYCDDLYILSKTGSKLNQRIAKLGRIDLYHQHIVLM